MGHNVLADVHVQVNSYLSVSEGHYVAEKVMKKLQTQFPEMNGITVHVDPEDDEAASPCGELPSRNEILAIIYPEIQKTGMSDDIRDILLHCIDGKVEIEVYLSSSHEQANLDALNNACQHCEDVRSVTIYTKVA